MRCVHHKKLTTFYNKTNMKRLLLTVFTFITLSSLAVQDPYGEADEDIKKEIENKSILYCREIDSLIYSYNMEIDADSYDIDNPASMEEAAYFLIGDRFYAWRQRESKYSWEYDVMIARYCY